MIIVLLLVVAFAYREITRKDRQITSLRKTVVWYESNYGGIPSNVDLNAFFQIRLRVGSAEPISDADQGAWIPDVALWGAWGGELDVGQISVGQTSIQYQGNKTSLEFSFADVVRFTQGHNQFKFKLKDGAIHRFESKAMIKYGVHEGIIQSRIKQSSVA